MAAPAAMQPVPEPEPGMLTADVAIEMTATLVVEGANGPTTPAAERLLHDRGVVVVPDLMANGGGVISSYYEWAENHQRVTWTEAHERRLVLERLDTSWEALASEEPQRWRDHALGIAISRVTDAMAFAGRVSVQHHHRRAAPDAGAHH